MGAIGHEFWVYIAIVAAVSVLSLIILDADLMQERMRPGGRRVACTFYPSLSSCSSTGPWLASTTDTSISVT
jgi:hypothetical protein